MSRCVSKSKKSERKRKGNFILTFARQGQQTEELSLNGNNSATLRAFNKTKRHRPPVLIL